MKALFLVMIYTVKLCVMKSIYRYIAIYIIALVTAGCTGIDMEMTLPEIELMARMGAGDDTKTSLSGLEGDRYYPLWSEGDEIAVFADNDNEPSRYRLTAGAGTTVASFKGNRSGEKYMALYPFDMAGTKADGKVSVVLPATQDYVPDSFGADAYPMLATGFKDSALEFYNLCSILKITIVGQCVVRAITLSSRGSELLSGSALAYLDSDGKPSLDFQKGSNSLTLNCNGAEVIDQKDFYIVIPAQNYEKGVEITVDAYTESITKIISSSLLFERSQIRHLKNLTVKLKTDQSFIAKERNALIAIYNSLGGDGWVDNENWCTDKHVSDWSNVYTDEEGHVVMISIVMNNVTGFIPKEIGDLEYMENLTINYADITAPLPKEIGKLKHLRYLQLVDSGVPGQLPDEIGEMRSLLWIDVRDNRLEGEIPKGIGNLRDLQRLDLSSNMMTGSIPSELSKCVSLEMMALNDNHLSGEIPSSINMPSLKVFSCFNNRLSGNIPSSVTSNEKMWRACWAYIINGNDFNLNDISIPGPSFTVEDIDGNIISTKQLYDNNDYTLFINWSEHYSVTDAHFETFVEIFDRYSDKGLGIIGYGHKDFSDLERVRGKINEFNLDWPYIQWTPAENSIIDVLPWNYCNFYPFYSKHSYMLVDDKGEVVYYDFFGDHLILKDFIYALYGDEDELCDSYVSKDYSADGDVHVIQRSSVGNGINMVLLGDAYSDRLIADGTYEKDMLAAYESLFSIEPYSSFKEYFNVYYVDAVSRNEIYKEDNYTAFGGWFGSGTQVGGNDDKCIQYAKMAVPATMIDETLIITIMNSDTYAGTCYIYDPYYLSNDYGSGTAVAYFPKGTDEEMFAQLLHHEACGHGFAKLADEYAYDYMGEIPSYVAEDTRSQQNHLGWWKNVDFTDDVTQVRWANFIEDERYANEGLGAYEGGLTYWTGVWRPTENSIMRYNTGGFNAPSREAIYYRIHKLAYGDDWEYDYEKFVEYDAINRAAAAGGPQKRRANYVEKQYEPLHPPVVVGKTWREASNY